MKKIILLSFIISLVGSGRLFAQYDMCFHTNPIQCPYVSTDPSNANGTICITVNTQGCAGGGYACDGGNQYCVELVAGSTTTCVHIPDCSFDPCMSYIIALIPAMTGGCNDANGDSTSGYSLQFINGVWTIRPYGEHGGWPITLTMNSDNSFTTGGTGM